MIKRFFGVIWGTLEAMDALALLLISLLAVVAPLIFGWSQIQGGSWILGGSEGGGDLMKAWITCLAAGLCSLGCTGPVEISDYDAGAVIEGAARSSTGEPLVGAAVQVTAYRSGCDQHPTATSGGGVFTGTDGRFEGEFSFLATGSVVGQCVGIQLVDTVTSTLLGDTLLVATLRFDAVRSDTLEVDLEF